MAYVCVYFEIIVNIVNAADKKMKPYSPANIVFNFNFNILLSECVFIGC